MGGLRVLAAVARRPGQIMRGEVLANDPAQALRDLLEGASLTGTSA
jgi:hypothetical protein